MTINPKAVWRLNKKYKINVLFFFFNLTFRIFYFVVYYFEPFLADFCKFPLITSGSIYKFARTTRAKN